VSSGLVLLSVDESLETSSDLKYLFTSSGFSPALMAF